MNPNPSASAQEIAERCADLIMSVRGESYTPFLRLTREFILSAITAAVAQVEKPKISNALLANSTSDLTKALERENIDNPKGREY